MKPIVLFCRVRPHELPLPGYQSPGASGMDLMADVSSEVTLQPLERFLFPTGFSVELPSGCEGQVRPRSGLALKKGLTVLNAPGTIDADYRGEMKVVLVNLSNEAATIAPGERIAQLVVVKVEQVNIQEVLRLSETQRGAGGFGSTGK
jgi:dUTP pyrophosphatase